MVHGHMKRQRPFLQALPLPLDPLRRAQELQVSPKAPQPLCVLVDSVPHVCRETAHEIIHPLGQLILSRYHKLGGRRRRRGPDIGDKVGDREVGLMPHGGDHRCLGRINGASHDLFVKAPQILDGTPSPGHNDDVEAAPLVQEFDPFDNLGG